MPLRSEQDFLRLIDEHFPDGPAAKLDGVELGRGDDCALVRTGGLVCVSSDLFLDTVHFRRSYFTPGEIGHKALACNLSDIAAMGCVPRFFSLDLLVGGDTDERFWSELLAGMAALAARHRVRLIGGDLSRSPLLGASVHIWGEPAPPGRVLRRGGAQPGDVLAVAGPVGMARAGLLALERSGNAARQAYPACTAAHLMPEPQVAAGLALAALAGVRGAMDVSDGLARDLPRLLGLDAHPEGGLGAELTIQSAEDGGPLHDEACRFATERGLDPAREAFLGGEDYCLLAALAPDAWDAAAESIPGLARIGTVASSPGIILNGKPFLEPGFDHFGD
ncbi:MAG: thiamine-phosphate kinase [Desulfovibrionaceae bacterium]